MSVSLKFRAKDGQSRRTETWPFNFPVVTHVPLFDVFFREFYVQAVRKNPDKLVKHLGGAKDILDFLNHRSWDCQLSDWLRVPNQGGHAARNAGVANDMFEIKSPGDNISVFKACCQ